MTFGFSSFRSCPFSVFAPPLHLGVVLNLVSGRSLTSLVGYRCLPLPPVLSLLVRSFDVHVSGTPCSDLTRFPRILRHTKPPTHASLPSVLRPGCPGPLGTIPRTRKRVPGTPVLGRAGVGTGYGSDRGPNPHRKTLPRGATYPDALTTRQTRSLSW